MTKKRILVVDDEPDILQVLEAMLKKEGYEFLAATTGESCIRQALSGHPDLIILDIMLPDGDGFEVCKKLKSDPKTSSIPVIMLTARDTTTDEVVGLELGADDYVRKPYDKLVFVTRIKRLFERRAALEAGKSADTAQRLEVGELVLDTKRQKIFIRKKEVPFTTLEFRILKIFAQNPGAVITRTNLIREAWKENVTIADRAVDVHLNSIREKLGPLSDYIETVYGSGYRLKELPSS